MRTNLREKGITLVALVVTIIILLILAGVTVSLVLGENGLLGRAQQASNTMANATANELKMMEKMDEQIGELVEKQYVPGLYDETTMEIKMTWEELVNENLIRDLGGKGYTSGNNSNRVDLLKGQIILPNDDSRFYDGIFQDCTNLTGELVITNNINSIPRGAFRRCNIEKIVIGRNVTEILTSAFYECTSLKGHLIIPETVDVIEAAAFYGCDNSELSIEVPKNISSVGPVAFKDVSHVYYTGQLDISNWGAKAYN